MAREYRILISKTRGGVINLATKGGWRLDVEPEYFKEINTNSDDTLGHVGQVFTTDNGYVALGYKE